MAALTAAWALLLAALSPVPSEDGVSYLWMAEQFAGGAFGTATSMVFPPGFPLLVAPWCASGVPAEWAAHLTSAIALALTAFPVARIAHHLAPDAGAALPAAILFVAGPLLLRTASEVYSEPVFLMLMAWGTWHGVQRRWWLLGAFAGAAFLVRPEGLLLAGSFVLAAPRQAWRTLLPAAVGVLLLAALRAAAGHGFDPLPILAFHETRDDLPERGQVLTNLLAVPGAWFEAFGLLAALWLASLLPAARRLRAGRAVALWWQIALQVGVVCTFVVRRRFFLSCAVPVAVLAGATVAVWPRAVRRVVLGLVVVAAAVTSFFGGIDADRRAERQLGAFLAAALEPGEVVAGDLTRVLWFAGQRPLPPRHFDAVQLAAMAAPGHVRYFVISGRSQRQSSRDVQRVLAATFAPLELPTGLRQACDARGILVLQRR